MIVNDTDLGPPIPVFMQWLDAGQLDPRTRPGYRATKHFCIAQNDDGNQLELTFVDSGGNEVRVEEWSATGDIGEDVIITDSQGQQFFLSGTRASVR